MDLTDHGSKVISDYIEFRDCYINIDANRCKYSYIIQMFETEKVCKSLSTIRLKPVSAK